jgi:hypothetical protein
VQVAVDVWNGPYTLKVIVPNVPFDGVAGAVSNVTVSWIVVPGLDGPALLT